MSNEVDSGRPDSVKVLGWQSNSEATPFEPASVGLGEDQTRVFQDFPIMLFDTQTDVATEPATISSDRLI